MINKNMIKLLIADDHAVVRSGIIHILEEDPELKVMGEAQNGDELMSKLYDEKWDVLVLDITMPGRNGLDLLIEIKKKLPALHVLILSMHPEEEIALRALKSGASGYLNKDSIPGELIKAIKKVNSGGKYISSSLAETIVTTMDKNMERPPHENLSEREFQVLCMLASGNSLSGIAAKLNLSVKTISTYRTRIMEKLNKKTNVDLTMYALKHKLVINK
jgi:DNA-binding NarL/FixJ family response regulator